MHKLLVFSFALLIVLSASGQKSKAYELRFKVKGVADTTAYLANYFGGKLYYKDTADVNRKGEFVFDGTEPLPTGKYAVVTPGPKYFEMFVQEQKFQMETDTADFIKHMVIKNSPNNEFLYDYIHFVSEKKKEANQLNKDLIEFGSDPVKSKELSERMVAINEEVVEHQEKIVAENPDLIAAKSLRLMIPIDVPDAPVREDGTIDSLFSYQYYLDHYFDHADLDDPNMVRLPEFQKKLDDFFNKTVIQSPDTITRYADQLIEKVKDTDELFQFVVQYITYNYETSQIMGMDAVFLHMAENYYQTGMASWADSTMMAKIDERVERMKPTMLGNVAPGLTLADTTLENWISVHEVDAPYTILFMYDPDCGHCKKKAPILVEKFEENKETGVIIFAVSGDEGEPWMKFIKDKGFDQEGIYNVTAPNRVFSDSKYATQLILEKKTDYESLNYRNTYDVFSTPKVFLLDSEKKIVAKQVGVEQVFDIMNDMISRKNGKDK